MTTDLPNNLSKNLDSILSTTNSYRERLEQMHAISKGKYCLWHQRAQEGHADNFGLMQECKDCMELIEKGRCEIDVCNFDLDTYWNVRNFWLKVDIQEPDKCWRWMGATRRDGRESIAYMPSPFHSAKTQSAPRVAFWLSRGYTGKYRIGHKETCIGLCCNPLHLEVQGLALPKPTEIKTINLSYGNIFQRAKGTLQTESSTAE